MRFVKDDVADKRPVDIESVIRRAVGVVQSEVQPGELAAHLEVHEAVESRALRFAGRRTGVRQSPPQRDAGISDGKDDGNSLRPRGERGGDHLHG